MKCNAALPVCPNCVTGRTQGRDCSRSLANVCTTLHVTPSTLPPPRDLVHASSLAGGGPHRSVQPLRPHARYARHTATPCQILPPQQQQRSTTHTAPAQLHTQQQQRSTTHTAPAQLHTQQQQCSTTHTAPAQLHTQQQDRSRGRALLTRFATACQQTPLGQLAIRMWRGVRGQHSDDTRE